MKVKRIWWGVLVLGWLGLWWAARSWGAVGGVITGGPTGTGAAAAGKSLTVSSSGPFLTIKSAVASANPGDCVIVFPGVYNENNLLKLGVNYYFYPGAQINYTNTGFDLASGYGIFDDRATGATTNLICGGLNFYYSYGTNLNNTCHGNTNAAGAVVLTNGNTYMRMEFNIADGDAFVDCAGVTINGTGSSPANFYIAKCRNNSTFVGVDLRNSRRLDTQNSVQNNIIGFYWENGDAYLNLKHVDPFFNYAIWPNTRTDTFENLWMTCDLCEGYIYASLTSSKNRCWYDFKELRVTNSVATDAFAPIGGKHYLRAEKISANDANGYCIRSSAGAEVWVTAQKLTYPTGGGWVSANGSTNYLWVQQYEPPATRTTAEYVSQSGGINSYGQDVFESKTNSMVAQTISLGQSVYSNLTAAVTFSGFTFFPFGGRGVTISGKATLINNSGADRLIGNPASWKTSDSLASRTLTSGNTMVITVDLTVGIATNAAISQFH